MLMNYKTVSDFKKDNKGAFVKASTNETPVVADDRKITFVISSGNPDRDNDVIKQSGIDTSNYKKNPVLLWGHDSSELPIGRCVEIGIVAGKMTATFELVPADVPCVGDRAEAVYQLCKRGFLFSTSIGFLPITWALSDDRDNGYDFESVQLLEVSVCSIPANPEALISQPVATPEPEKSTDILNRNEGARAHRKRVLDVLNLKR